ncbi:MAG: RelA/SpoT family protein [Weeksellaceae bacterium]|nr:RelA/SpoT family protein [Weeksellaceae bacterium]
MKVMTVEELEKEKTEIALRYKNMLQSSYRFLSDADKQLIRKAFDLAVDAHKDQRRKSGEPYIYHPIEVAKIIANEIGLGATSIAAALMHDVVEDSEYTLEDIENQFDSKIAKIIDGLTKISTLNNQEVSIQSENFRKLLLTLSEDVRVILIKIADRLHNMRTLESMREDKQMKIASETIFIYAPLAHRMGLYNIKSELEDLSLKYTQPEVYEEIQSKLIASHSAREEYIQKFSQRIKESLDEEGIKYQIKGRPKSISSIHKKIMTQGVSFEEVYDKFAIRIIYESDQKNEKYLAWKIFSIVTDIYKHNPKRMRDWISQPRSTGYESLHATLMGPGGNWVEVQIRSERMDEIAEKGIAAHYKYKENYNIEDSKVDDWIAQIREILENHHGSETAEFIDNFKLNLYAKEIFVFTPMGDLFSLPKGASSLDFAYAIHTNVGDTCLGAKVNGKLYPLSHELQSGDQVEIITSTNQRPKPDWLDFVKTSRAKSKIKAALNAEKRYYAEEGREILERKMRHLKQTLNEKTLNALVSHFKEKTSQDLFVNVQSGKISNADLKKFAEGTGMISGIWNRIRPKPKPKEKIVERETHSHPDLVVFGDDEEKLEYTLANCCNPIPGDKVFGFVTVNRGIKVHKNSCPNSIELRANFAYRIQKAKWVDSTKTHFRTILNLHGIDRQGMVNDITHLVSTQLNLDMKSISIYSDDGIFEGKITVVVNHKQQLDDAMASLSKIQGMTKVRRVDN